MDSYATVARVSPGSSTSPIFVWLIPGPEPSTPAKAELGVFNVERRRFADNPDPVRGLELSLAKWYTIRDGLLFMMRKGWETRGITPGTPVFADGGPQTCALCWMYLAVGEGVWHSIGQSCRDCPIRIATGRPHCEGTPYTMPRRTPTEALHTATMEIDFLEKVREAQATGFSCTTCMYAKYEPALMQHGLEMKEAAGYRCHHAHVQGTEFFTLDELGEFNGHPQFVCDCYRIAPPGHETWADEEPLPF